MKIACHFLCPDMGRYIFNEIRYIFNALLEEGRDIHAKIRLGDILIYNSRDKDKIVKNFVQMLTDVEDGWAKVSNDEKDWLNGAQYFCNKVFGKNFFAITFEHINESDAIFIHNALSKLDNYVGSFEVNSASRIHWYLYTECISEEYRIDGRKLFLLWRGSIEEDKSFHTPDEWDGVGFESIEFENVEYEVSSPPAQPQSHAGMTPDAAFSDDAFHALFHPFKREASLIEGILHVGLTSLRASNLFHYGNAYVSFFNLSIGIERICKFIIILDYMIQNNIESPPYSEIKNYSHKLVDIYKKIEEISRNYEEVEDKIGIQNGSIEADILNFLDRFARATRYQNINELCNIPQSDDHLIVWKDIINRIMDEEVPEKTKDKATQVASALYDLIKENSIIRRFGYDRKFIPQDKVFITAQLEEKAKPRAIRHILNIIAPLCKLTWTIGGYTRKMNIEYDNSVMIFPEMNEFFREIVPYPGQRVLKKKRWKTY